MEVSDPAERPPSKVKELFWTAVTVLVWLVLIAGIATLVRVTVDVAQGDSSGFLLFWPLLITVAAGSALLGGSIVRLPLNPIATSATSPGWGSGFASTRSARSSASTSWACSAG